jgi:hypothetical protein
MTKKKFLYNLSRASYQKNWGKNFKPPTFWEITATYYGGTSFIGSSVSQTQTVN